VIFDWPPWDKWALAKKYYFAPEFMATRMSALGHVWTAPRQELSNVVADISQCNRHVRFAPGPIGALHGPSFYRSLGIHWPQPGTVKGS
jgi:hypothetical protein